MIFLLAKASIFKARFAAGNAEVVVLLVVVVVCVVKFKSSGVVVELIEIADESS